MIYLAAMTIGSQLVLVADVPEFDARPSCRAAAAAAVMVGRTSENCMDDERAAHGQLEKSWADFSASDKTHCLSLLKAGGGPSYVELLSCLEMSRDARRIAQERIRREDSDNAAAGAQTTGSGGRGDPIPPPARP